MADLARIVLNITQQPNSTVLEGDWLRQRPEVQVLMNVSLYGGGSELRPLPGVRLIALPYMQAGLRTPTLTSPQFARELGILGGTPLAVLANLGQQKLLANFTSEPTDANGTARWTNMSFTRHGPAGAYTLTFALAGVHFEAETAVIKVNSSVASVQTVVRSNFSSSTPAEAVSYGRQLAGAAEASNVTARCSAAGRGGWQAVSMSFNVTICNWPACKYAIGGAYGSPIYMDELLRQGNKTNQLTALAKLIAAGNIPPDITLAELAPFGPSGYLVNAPAVQVLDAHGRPLAGKAVSAQVWRVLAAADAFTPGERVIAGVRVVNDDGIVVREFPGTGSTTTVLSRALVPTQASEEGVAVFLAKNVEPGDKALEAYAAATGQLGSFFRVLAAPSGTTTGRLVTFAADDSDSDCDPLVANLTVLNLDLAANDTVTNASCAYLEMTSLPSAVLQETISLQAPFESGVLAVQAYDSFGRPLQAALTIQQHAASVLGVVGWAVNSTQDGGSLILTPSVQAYLARMGGGAAVASGDFASADLLGDVVLLPALLSSDANADGSWQSSYSGVMNAQQSYVQYVFVSTSFYGNNTAASYFPQSACYSAYTPPIAVKSLVRAVEWQQLPAAVACVADGQTLIDPLPQPVVYFHNGSVADNSSAAAAGFFAVRFDNALMTYPTGEGMIARPYTVLFSERVALGLPQTRLVDDPGDSILLPLNADVVVPGNFNPLLSIPVFSLGGMFMVWNATAASLRPLEPGEQLQFNAPDSTGGGGVLPMGLRTGSAGTYHLVAYVQGTVSEGWARLSCSDNVTAVAISEISVGSIGSCPPGVHVYDHNKPVGIVEPEALCSQNGPNNFTGCTGHGTCACGVCVCAAPYDGAPDCSRLFTDDDWGVRFTFQEPYSSQYKGLPVWDVRTAMTLAANASYVHDVFPRIFFPTAVAGHYPAGVLESLVQEQLDTLLAHNASNGSSVAGLFSTEAAFLSQRVADAVASSAFSLFKRTPDTGHRAFPVLITCAGDPVPDAYFTAVSPRPDRCSDASVLPASDSSATLAQSGPDSQPPIPGQSGWSSYVVALRGTRNQASGGFNIDTSAPIADKRLMLRNVPSGCYRFKLVVYPHSRGSFDQHSAPPASLVASSHAVSIAATRPFRVLAPVVEIAVVQWPSLYIPFDTPMPQSPWIRLTVRTLPGQPNEPLRDDCVVQFRKSLVTIDSPFLSRCAAVSDGFPVYVSAVSYATGDEFPLYQVSATNDCTRALIPAAGPTVFDSGNGDKYQCESPSCFCARTDSVM